MGFAVRRAVTLFRDSPLRAFPAARHIITIIVDGARSKGRLTVGKRHTPRPVFARVPLCIHAYNRN